MIRSETAASSWSPFRATWGLCATILRSSSESGSDRDEWVEGVDAQGEDDPRELVLLASDAGYGRPSFRQGLRPGLVVDADLAAASLDWVRRVGTDPRCRSLIVNHDPEVVPGPRRL